MLFTDDAFSWDPDPLRHRLTSPSTDGVVLSDGFFSDAFLGAEDPPEFYPAGA